MDLYRRSVKHLDSVQETYWRHGLEALWIGARLVGAAVAVVIHAAVPALFTHTASDTAASIVQDRRRRETLGSRD